MPTMPDTAPLPDTAQGRRARIRRISRLVLALLFIFAGLNHFIALPIYTVVIPPYLPYPKVLVIVSGLAEMALGGLLLTRWSVWAAWGIAALLVCVFPANIYMAQTPSLFPNIPPILLWLRLPLQLPLIAWAIWHTLPNTRGR